MDLHETIQNLLDHKERLDKVIRCLEIVEREDDPTLPRPGRKGMTAEERRQVSARMKEFWASKRKQRKQSG